MNFPFFSHARKHKIFDIVTIWGLKSKIALNIGKKNTRTLLSKPEQKLVHDRENTQIWTK